MGALLALAAFTVFVGFLYLLTLYIAQSLGEDPLATGLQLLPAGVAAVLAAGAGEALARRAGRKLPVTGGLLLIAAGGLLLTGLQPGDGYTPVLWAGLLLGAGTGLVVPSVTDAVMANAPSEQGGTAGATADAAIEVGAALGIAVLGSVLTTVYRDGLPDRLLAGLPDGMRAAVEDSLGGALDVAAQAGPAGPALRSAADSAFVDGLATAGLVGGLLALTAALAAAVLLPSRDHQPAPANNARASTSSAPAAPAR
jgi:hypothetical protein